MRSTNWIAILLTFLVLLLVLTSAVVFLTLRNQDLDQEVQDRQTEREALAVTKTQLESDLAFLESEIDSASATRDKTEDQVKTSESTIEALLTRLVPTQEPTAEVVEEPLVEEPHLVVFSPGDGAIVRPMETVIIYMAAHAKNGVDHVELVVDDGQAEIYPAGGLITFTLPVRWEVPSEGTYTIKLRAVDMDGLSSQSQTIVLEAKYLNDEERLSAERNVQLADLSALRFLDSIHENASSSTSSGPLASRELQLLTGWESYEASQVVTKTAALLAFSFIPPGYDLADYLQAIEDVLLVYDWTGEAHLVSTDGVEGSDAFTRWIRAHDLTHYLQEERFQLDLLDFTAMDSDARLAMRALIEGEAVFLQHFYLQSDSFTTGERRYIETALESNGTFNLDTLPMFLRKEFEFAFSSGFAFINRVYEEGGSAALDVLWRNPPLSTEQILHPEKYLAKDDPRPVSLASIKDVLQDALGEGWRFVAEDVFGEFSLGQYLSQSLEDELARDAAAGWAGGRYALFTNEDETSLAYVLKLAWDTTTDQEEFDAAFRQFMDHRSGVEGASQDGGSTCWLQGKVTCLYQLAGDEVVSSEDQTADGSLIIQANGVTTAEGSALSIINP